MGDILTHIHIHLYIYLHTNTLPLTYVHLNIHTHIKAGFQGGGLHGGHHPGGGSGFYELLNGSRFLNGLISVTYELYDTHCNDGGFCCIPGII